MGKKIALQFSGGIDSLYLAHLLAEKYECVHLLTFEKGYLHFALRAAAKNVARLQKLHGKDKVVFKIIDMKELFRAMAVKSYFSTSRKFGNETAWCIPCRAAMGVASTLYCLQHEIGEFTDGANSEQRPDGKRNLATADNYPEFLQLISDFARSFGITYSSILYELNSREERRAKLSELGFEIDFNSLGHRKKSIFDPFKPSFYKRSQPMCVSGYLVHWRRNLFNVVKPPSPEQVVESIKPKLDETGLDYVKRKLKTDPQVEIRADSETG